jgi:hypothetical protein
MDIACTHANENSAEELWTESPFRGSWGLADCSNVIPLQSAARLRVPGNKNDKLGIKIEAGSVGKCIWQRTR